MSDELLAWRGRVVDCVHTLAIEARLLAEEAELEPEGAPRAALLRAEAKGIIHAAARLLAAARRAV